jgi:hypothetical protein
MANLAWSVFVAATKRPMRLNLDWDPFYAIAREKAPFREKLAAYAAIARKRFEADRFEEFTAKHLAHLPEVTREFFGTERAKDAVRQKTAALYPAHEVEAFTDLFWERIQKWRSTPEPAPTARPAAAQAAAPAAARAKSRSPKAATGRRAPVRVKA